MRREAYPILEFDPTRKAIIEPNEHIPRGDVPEHAVICFFTEVIQKIVQEHQAKMIFTSISEMGKHPIYEIELNGKRLAFFHPGVGAALAVGLMEEAIALGINKFVACGGCGVLDKAVGVGHILVPAAAVRDEGTSYHYAAPAREIEMDPDVLAVLESVLQAHHLPFYRVKTWTTDAIYRETPQKAAARLAEGCLSVEMETAAFLALAQFRSVRFGQYLYGGDAVLEDAWDGREWHSRQDIRENLFWLAAEACLQL